MKIKVVKGLDIPIEGKPFGKVSPLIGSGETEQRKNPKTIALNLENFDLRFHLLAKLGDYVTIGQPIAEDKKTPGRYFVSPGSGIITEIQRGLKRAIRNIVVTLEDQEKYFHFDTQKELIPLFKEAGVFSKIRMRPFNLLADPDKLPHCIFVKAIESAPFTPPAEMQIAGYEKAFQTGLTALSQIAPVHLIYSEETTYTPFVQAEHVTHHTASGPHPIGNASVHIQAIAPIRNPQDIVWTLNAQDVTYIGQLLLEGTIRFDKVISIAGPSVLPEKRGYFQVREGIPITSLISGRIGKEASRLISGDPLMGHQVSVHDFLGFSDFVFCVFPELKAREFLHFFRLGVHKYSFSRAYLSGHLPSSLMRERGAYPFTTALHGEPRAFIDSTLLDQVQPLPIPTMLLVKAIMGEDFEQAEKLGLLEVAPEDFALPTFVCPSKIEMVEIVKQGLMRCATDRG